MGLDISYANRALETVCTDARQAKRRLGEKGFEKLKRRLADLRAAANVRLLVAGRPHPLRGDRAGQFAVDLEGGSRLVFEPANNPVPKDLDGATAWDQVTAIRIVFIGDYHD